MIAIDIKEFSSDIDADDASKLIEVRLSQYREIKTETNKEGTYATFQPGDDKMFTLRLSGSDTVQDKAKAYDSIVATLKELAQ